LPPPPPPGVVSVKWWKSVDVTSDLLHPLAASIAIWEP